MKQHIFIFISVVLFQFTSRAQVPFEKLDSLSTVVSQWQKLTEGTTYKDAGGTLHTLSFPDDNFQIWSSDRLATMAVFKNNGTSDVLALTENIDLSQATGISISENHFGVTYIKVDFPDGHLKTQNYTDDAAGKITQPSYLEFFCRYGALNADKKFYFDLMFDMVYALCNMLKVEKGKVTVQTISDELNDWQKLNADAFLAKHPKSLMAAQARLNR